MISPAKEWTVAEVIAIPEDGRRHELVDGVLYINGVAIGRDELDGLDRARTPSPSLPHQRMVVSLTSALHDYPERQRVGMAMIGPADLQFIPGQLIAPDVFVLPTPNGKPPHEWEDIRSLHLVIEIVSATTARLDRVIKRRIYQSAGIPEYWIVDLDAELIERWRPDDKRPESLTEQITWHPAEASEALVIDLEEIFTR